MEGSILYSVTDSTRETHNVVTLTLQCENDLSRYCAGQFITVYFPDTNHREGKSYSISKVIDAHHFSITVKDIGEFSHRLSVLNVGDTLMASLPYGYFYSESTTSSLILVAGGIGIAPFRAILLASLEKNPFRPVMLFCSIQYEADGIFRNELEVLSKKYPKNFSLYYYVTQENSTPPLRHGRIPVRDIIELSKDLPDREFMLCGSIAFVRDFWRGLKASGIPEETIYTEAFF